jgi:hypothetical protein
MTQQVMIDPNVRVAGNQTFSGFEDILAGDLPEVGDVVVVREPESGITGSATVTRVDYTDRLIYLAVDWANLMPPIMTPDELMLGLGLVGVTLATPSATHSLSRLALTA